MTRVTGSPSFGVQVIFEPSMAVLMRTSDTGGIVVSFNGREEDWDRLEIGEGNGDVSLVSIWLLTG